MRQRQRGISLTGLLSWGVIVAIVAMLGIKVAPELIEYYKILKDVKATAAAAGNQTVPEIRNSFAKFAEIDHIKTIGPADLEVTKEGGQVVVSFGYERKIPLFGGVSLLIEFSGSSSGRE